MNRRPLIIGHRGASAVAPENTLRAFRTAIEAGADGIEFDVQLSRDRVPVVIHDDNLRRTGLVNGVVAELSADELKKIHVGQWFWRKQKEPAPGEPDYVPTLEELFALYHSTPGLLYLEMKPTQGNGVDLAQVCCQTIGRSSLKERIIVESFDLNAIAEMKRLDSSVKTAALFEPRFCSPPRLSGRGLIDHATAVGADEIALHHRFAHARLIGEAQRAGLGVVVWTVDDPKWLATAHALEIDALITNDPSGMIQAK